MNKTDIVNIRLINQQVMKQKLKTTKEIVGWLGAMQAQDYEMVKWAVGVRIPGIDRSSVEVAIDKGDIIRTHLMRPTWHIVAAEDIYWMLELTAPRIKSSLTSRHKQLEITPHLISKCNSLIVKTINAREGSATREELTAEFEKANIDMSNNRAAHLLMLAELDCLICNGKIQGKKTTYALLQDKVPKVGSLPRDETLERLARKYFTSHGPATLEDFGWWSGLVAKDANLALEMIKPDLMCEVVNSKSYWLSTSNNFSKDQNDKSVHLLPAFDEFMISYKDRSAVVSDELQKKAISSNGIFWPVIVMGGKVKGRWKRTIKKDKLLITIQSFGSLSKKDKQLIEEKAVLFGNFLGKEMEISYAEN